MPTVTGLLMIGREESIRRSVAPTSHVPGAFRDGGSSQRFFHDPLLKLIETLLERFRARNERGDRRYVSRSVPDYDERAFREALIQRAVSQGLHSARRCACAMTDNG